MWVVRPIPVSLPSRIRAKIDVDEQGCWLWNAAKDEHGYAKLGWEGRNRRAHIIVRLLLVGPTPDGQELDHTCRRRHCVNPSHLEPVTHAENLARSDLYPTLSAKYAEPRDCPQGHPMAGDNLVVTKTKAGHVNRKCRICRNAAVQRCLARKRAGG